MIFKNLSGSHCVKIHKIFFSCPSLFGNLISTKFNTLESRIKYFMGLLPLRFSPQCVCPCRVEKISDRKLKFGILFFLRWTVIYVVLTTLPWRNEFSLNAFPFSFIIVSPCRHYFLGRGVNEANLRCENARTTFLLLEHFEKKNKREILWLCIKFFLCHTSLSIQPACFLLLAARS